MIGCMLFRVIQNHNMKDPTKMRLQLKTYWWHPKDKKSKSKTWGPIQVERRSKRNPNDTRIALEKSQDIKKWSPQDIKGKKTTQPLILLQILFL